jgi:hypothetical protein
MTAENIEVILESLQTEDAVKAIMSQHEKDACAFARWVEAGRWKYSRIAEAWFKTIDKVEVSYSNSEMFYLYQKMKANTPK